MTDHIISAISYKEDKNGNFDPYISPILDNTVPSPLDNNLDDIKLTEIIIDDIKYIEGGLGLFSSKYIDYCEFQREFYDCIKLNIIKCAVLLNIHYPYNSIQCHPKNQYKFDCLELFFKMNKNILVCKENTLPKFINIKRSSGKIQKSMINSHNSFSLYRTKQDNYEKLHLGLKVGFTENEKDMNEDSIFEHLPYTKIVLYKDIMVLNPEIKKLNFTYSLLDVNKYDNLETFEKKKIVHDVIKYFNNIYLNWINDTIENNLNDINCDISFEKV